MRGVTRVLPDRDAQRVGPGRDPALALDRDANRDLRARREPRRLVTRLRARDGLAPSRGRAVTELEDIAKVSPDSVPDDDDRERLGVTHAKPGGRRIRRRERRVMSLDVEPPFLEGRGRATRDLVRRIEEP